MRVIITFIGLTILTVLGVLFLAFGGRWLGLQADSFFLPWEEQIRYDTFKATQPFNEGMIRDLENIRMQYIKSTTTADEKTTLRAIAIHRFAAYDTSKLSPELRNFYESLKNGN
jgi:hypothetical protein